MRTAPLLIITVAILVGSLLAGPNVGAERSEAPPDETLRWIAVGGGAEPASTQVSLEQDLALAREVLGPRGLVLFAGGAKAFGVQVLAPTKGRDSLRRELGDLFDPRDGRDSRYRLPEISPDGAATRTRLVAELERAGKSAGGEPLLVYVATHGDAGDTPRDNSIALWGGDDFTVGELADILDAMPGERVVRLVVAACYSGGFAELAFSAADPDRGAASTPRCGLFAARWDEESSGCDPNPDRRAQQGYGIHFLHALRGEGRDGHPLPSGAVDYDGDGRVSLLEAHTRARIASASFGTPTTTSERWLRQSAPPEDGDSPLFLPVGSGDGPLSLPEEEAVIAGLGKQLSLADRDAAEGALQRLEAETESADRKVAEQEKDEARAFAALRIALLERWPALDDPWHPDFSATLDRHAKEIRRVLSRSSEAVAYRAARERLDRLWASLDSLRVRSSRVRRLVRAYETRSLASRLRAVGGEAWGEYRRLLACERGVP